MQLGKSRQPSQGGEAGKGLRSNDRDVPLSGKEPFAGRGRRATLRPPNTPTHETDSDAR